MVVVPVVVVLVVVDLVGVDLVVVDLVGVDLVGVDPVAAVLVAAVLVVVDLVGEGLVVVDLAVDRVPKPLAAVALVVELVVALAPTRCAGVEATLVVGVYLDGSVVVVAAGVVEAEAGVVDCSPMGHRS